MVSRHIGAHKRQCKRAVGTKIILTGKAAGGYERFSRHVFWKLLWRLVLETVSGGGLVVVIADLGGCNSDVKRGVFVLF